MVFLFIAFKWDQMLQNDSETLELAQAKLDQGLTHPETRIIQFMVKNIKEPEFAMETDSKPRFDYCFGGKDFVAEGIIVDHEAEAAASAAAADEAALRRDGEVP